MSTKIELNLLTGEVNEIELTGKELEAYNFALENPVVNQVQILTPTKEQLMSKLLEIQAQLENL